ncbi:imm11 family protein [Mesorhizobium argentiipisi]|uniref:imm11 family protein n=1 Tax=Mesorhizobium argentiipisi TaxID=3015175 RepID=UPI00301E4017
MVRAARSRPDPQEIGSAEVFKLPMRASPVFVNDVFVERVRKAGLRNVSFEPVWTPGTAIA